MRLRRRSGTTIRKFIDSGTSTRLGGIMGTETGLKQRRSGIRLSWEEPKTVDWGGYSATSLSRGLRASASAQNLEPTLTKRRRGLGPDLLALAERQGDQRLLLEFVSLGRTRGRGGIGGALDAAKLGTNDATDARHHERQRTHVGRLFLHPDEFRGLRVAIERRAQILLGKGIHLFQHHDGRAFHLELAALHAQFVANLA